MQNLQFDNVFTASLPADEVTDNIRHTVTDAIYSPVTPTPVKAPYLAGYSREVAQMLGLSDADCRSEAFLQVLSGNRLLPGMEAHATCYGGHQFGNWAGQLGDGRAINLGEVNTRDGHLMLQLKGAGETPYSRTADGLAVMRSSVREFLCSEAMYHLGVPTTRALSLIGTGEEVMRDMLYDGHPQNEPGAVVCRVSSSFVRFGHFQILAARGEQALLERFTRFVIQREFPNIASDQSMADQALALFDSVCERTARLMVEWMRVGFVHGVMNTDNMSILGETIDYGPYGWLEDFDPDWTPNTTDAGQRRYRYGQQPAIGQWNLMQLANALLPLTGDAKPFEEALSRYAAWYESGWRDMMANKLGLATYNEPLVDALHSLLTTAETDMTLFYTILGDHSPELAADALADAYYQPDQFQATAGQRQQWLQQYQQVLVDQSVSETHRTSLMSRVNPKYVLRNYLAQLVIDEVEQGNFTPLHDLHDVLRQPYADQPGKEEYALKRPEWARTRVGCSMLSCSS